MRQRPNLSARITLPLGPFRMTLGLAWVLILTGGLWGLAAYVIPLAAPGLSTAELWAAAGAATLLLLLSPILHLCGHILAARLLGGSTPAVLPIEIFGDPAQIWPVAPSALRDVIITLAGPLASGLQATIWALIWNAQLHPAVNSLAFLATMLNTILAVINLAPGLPLDGGRIVRGMLWADLASPRSLMYARTAGIALAVALAGWGMFLISLGARFSLETGIGTIAAALVLLFGLRHPAQPWPAPASGVVAHPVIAWLSVVFVLGLKPIVAAGLLPLVDGLYSPGPAVSVEPMVRVPPERRSESGGELLLTTVVAQTPITLAQRIYALLDPAFLIVAPERIVPRDTTPQQVMRRNVQMLEESEAVAIVVGMRLAGHQAELTSSGLQVVEVTPESPSAGRILAGDQILSVDGVATPRLDLLRSVLAGLQPGSLAAIEIERAGQQLTVSAPLMDPAEAGGPPRIGIVLQPIGLDVVLPFPVSIEEQKIAGGPSAGLMFALAVYDLLTPDDLTRGWRVAGTGTIALDGVVGPIGGVAQKVAGAEWAGADYFIVPREHEAEARQVARRIRILPVGTVEEAIAALRALPAGR